MCGAQNVCALIFLETSFLSLKPAWHTHSCVSCHIPLCYATSPPLPSVPKGTLIQ